MLAIGPIWHERSAMIEFQEDKTMTELKEAWAANRKEITELKRVAGEESEPDRLISLCPSRCSFPLT